MDQFVLTAARRRLAAFSSAAIVLALGATMALGFTRVLERRALVARTREVIRAGDDLMQRLTDAETGQRGFIMTGDSSYLEPYRGATADVQLAERRLRTLTAGDAAQRARVDTLEGVVARRLRVLDERVAIRASFGFDSARASLMRGGGKTLMDSARRLYGTMERHEDSLLAAGIAAEDREARLLFVVIALGTVLAAAIALLLNQLFARYAAGQARARTTLTAQNEALRAQAEELGFQQEQLEEQAGEMESQAAQLQEQAAELEMANEELQASARELEERARVADVLRDEADAARRAAEEANRAKSEFLTVMSHELRTPLNAIAGYVELLELGLRGPVTPAQLEDLTRIRHNGRYLLGLINDILSFARIEVGRMELQLESVEVGQIVASLETIVSPQVSAGGLRLEVIESCGERRCGSAVLADPERVRQIVLNLLTNAIKFTPPGGRVTVRCGCEPDSVWVAVSDTGPGIPDAKLDAIFQPFVQIGRHLHRTSQQGIGLGLAISRELARRMGGDVTVDSREGEGSTFTLRLPRLPAGVSATDAVLPLARGIDRRTPAS